MTRIVCLADCHLSCLLAIFERTYFLIALPLALFFQCIFMVWFVSKFIGQSKLTNVIRFDCYHTDATRHMHKISFTLFLGDAPGSRVNKSFRIPPSRTNEATGANRHKCDD